jgi:phosphatidate cytidylyltransferase
MAINWKTFRTRALTSLFFVAIMLVGLLVNEWTFFILFSVIHFGCWIEYQQLMAKTYPSYSEITPFHKYGVIIAGWCMMLYATGYTLSIGPVSLSSLGFWLGLLAAFVLPVIEMLFARKIDLANIKYSFLGLLYISLSLSLLVDLRSGRPWLANITMGTLFQEMSLSIAMITGFVLPLVIIASLWINDTMAYIVGSFIGKTPLTAISPKKTWEGTIGGIILCIVSVTLFGVYFLKGEAWQFIALSGIAAVAGTFGDLLESKLKRMAGVKDSGEIMPGHGGFLDRFDSLLITVPFIWIFCILFMR